MNKKLIIVTIIFISIFLIGVTIYKIFFNKEKEDLITAVVVKKEKKILKNGDNTDKELYSGNIITENVKNYDYELIIDDIGIVGKIYINDEGYLYIYDSINNISYRVSTTKMITLKEEYNLDGLLTIYAISNDYKLYYIFLNKTDVTKTIINEIKTDFKVKNFTTLQFKNTFDFIPNIIVLSDNDEIYEARTGIRYNSEIITFMGNYYVYNDNTIANSYGNMIKDENDNYLKIKYYVEILDNKNLFEKVYSIIITADDRIIYSEENSEEIKIYNKYIKNIDYESSEMTVNQGKAKIVFEDNSSIEFTGACYSGFYELE